MHYLQFVHNYVCVPCLDPPYLLVGFFHGLDFCVLIVDQAEYGASLFYCNISDKLGEMSVLLGSGFLQMTSLHFKLMCWLSETSTS